MLSRRGSAAGAGGVGRAPGVAQHSQELQEAFARHVGQAADLVEDGLFFTGEGRSAHVRGHRAFMAYVGKDRAGGQPLRVLSQQTGEGEEMLQFDVFAEAQLPLIHRGRRDVQRLGHVRLGQARLLPRDSNPFG